MKQGLIANNPFECMSSELPISNKNKTVNTYEEEDEISSLYAPQQVKKKTFTGNEMKAIIDAVKHTRGKHNYPVIHFFLTGTRTNEASSLMWSDVKGEKEYLVIQRSYFPR